jgi:hypothetical protein
VPVEGDVNDESRTGHQIDPRKRQDALATGILLKHRSGERTIVRRALIVKSLDQVLHLHGKQITVYMVRSRLIRDGWTAGSDPVNNQQGV